MAKKHFFDRCTTDSLVLEDLVLGLLFPSFCFILTLYLDLNFPVLACPPPLNSLKMVRSDTLRLRRFFWQVPAIVNFLVFLPPFLFPGGGLASAAILHVALSPPEFYLGGRVWPHSCRQDAHCALSIPIKLIQIEGKSIEDDSLATTYFKMDHSVARKRQMCLTLRKAWWSDWSQPP